MDDELHSMKPITGLGFDAVTLFSTVFFGIAPVAGVLHYLLFPNSPIYLPTIFPQSVAQSVFVYWTFTLIPAFFCYCVTQTMLVVIMFGMAEGCK